MHVWRELLRRRWAVHVGRRSLHLPRGRQHLLRREKKCDAKRRWGGHIFPQNHRESRWKLSLDVLSLPQKQELRCGRDGKRGTRTGDRTTCCTAVIWATSGSTWATPGATAATNPSARAPPEARSTASRFLVSVQKQTRTCALPDVDWDTQSIRYLCQCGRCKCSTGTPTGCEYNGVYVAVGDAIPDPSGCGHCLCHDDGLIYCTQMLDCSVSWRRILKISFYGPDSSKVRFCVAWETGVKEQKTVGYSYHQYGELKSMCLVADMRDWRRWSQRGSNGLGWWWVQLLPMHGRGTDLVHWNGLLRQENRKAWLLLSGTHKTETRKKKTWRTGALLLNITSSLHQLWIPARATVRSRQKQRVDTWKLTKERCRRLQQRYKLTARLPEKKNVFKNDNLLTFCRCLNTMYQHSFLLSDALEKCLLFTKQKRLNQATCE